MGKVISLKKYQNTKLPPKFDIIGYSKRMLENNSRAPDESTSKPYPSMSYLEACFTTLNLTERLLDKNKYDSNKLNKLKTALEKVIAEVESNL